MDYCPSHDWDRHCDEMEQAAIEANWWVKNEDRVLSIVSALIASNQVNAAQMSAKDIVDIAARVTAEVTHRKEMDH